MKISYFHYLYGSGGGWHHARQFVAAAKELGYCVSVHAMNCAPPPDSKTLTHRVRKRLKTTLSRYLHEPKEILRNVRYIARALRIVQSERPDVMLVRSHHLTFAEVAVRAIANIPLVIEVNAPASESNRYFRDYAHVPGAGFITEHVKLRHADRVVAVSSALARYLIDTHCLPPGKVSVNPNGVDCELFRPEIDGQHMRQRLKVSSDVVVGFVANLQPWHGAALLEEIIGPLSTAGVRFLLVGGGPRWGKLRERLLARFGGNGVTITDHVPHREVPAYIAAMDIALVPDSNFYGCSLKTLEYMASGRPLVAPGYGPFEELIENGRDGLLFRPGDTGAAVNAITRLIRDESLRKRLGDNARRRVTREFTWRHNAERVVNACRDALGAKFAAVSRPSDSAD